jgi:hypothetical protein
MAEEIVACPSCSKKFRIPEGAPPGSFACTACGANVPYGKGLRAAARPAASRPAATRPAAASRPAAATSSRAASATRAAPARAHARHPREEVDEGPPKKSLAWLWWICGIAAGAVIIVLVFNATKPPPPPAVQPLTIPSSPKPPETAKPATPEPAKSEAAKPPAKPEAAKPTESAKPAGSDATAKPNDPAKPEDKAPEPPKRPTTAAILGQPVASVAGTTDEERSEMERMLATVLDRDAGSEASVAESKLRGQGKKAIPVLLSVFSKQFQAGKWGNENDQWGAEKVQDILHMIVRADKPRNDFTAKFTPGGLSPSDDFEKAARMWIEWWNVTGQMKEKYRKGDEEGAGPPK